MEVILLNDVPKVGKKFAIVHVAPGFARNFLLARGLAEPVTKSNAKKVADLQHKREAEEARQAEMLAKAMAGMKDVTIDFTRKANEEGSLYAIVSRSDIAEELSKKIGTLVTADHLHSEHAIKSTGDHAIVVKLGDKEAKITVVVTAEE